MPTHAISADLPDALYNRLNAAAERTETSLSQITIQALQCYLDTQDQHHQITLAALADVDAGCTITAQEMDAWMSERFGPPPVNGKLE